MVISGKKARRVITNPSVIDLFCGIGGLGLGAARAGFHLALAVDKDSTLLDVHRMNFPSNEHLESDVSTLTGSEILAAAKLDDCRSFGLIGGSPCQGFSRIGRRETNDARNVLFLHFFRLVSELRPLFFVAENVPGITDPKNRPLVDRARAMVGSGYTMLDPMVLDASEFGAPTIRKRVFFVGYVSDRFERLEAADFYGEKWTQKTTVETALAGLPRRLKATWLSDDVGWRPLRVVKHGPYWTKIYGDIPAAAGDKEALDRFRERRLVSGCIATEHTSQVVKRFGNVLEGQVDLVSRAQRLRRNGHCPTLRAGTGSDRGSFQALRPIHFQEPRVITPREAARLQGFPDWFRFGATKWHAFRGIGNSVSPFVSEAIFRTIYRKLVKTVGMT
jgi:DNA (cytosine-5)-methyltransferase 1